jgi:hypothetical protein
MIDRRRALLGLAGLGLASTTGGAVPRGGLDFADRRDLLTAIAKMRGSTDGRLTIGYVVGTRYAVPAHSAIPMMGILAATFSRYQRVSDEAFEARTLEIAYFTDVVTGRLLEKWKNPLTGAVVDVPQTRMGPSLIRVTADGLSVPRPAGEAAGLELRHRFLEPVVVGDDVWITEDIRVQGPPGRAAFVYNEFSTYHARKSELDDPARAIVPTRVDYQSLITYRPWMGFGDAPGHTIARGSGARVARIEDMPPYYLELTRRYHPDVLQNPLAALG